MEVTEAIGITSQAITSYQIQRQIVHCPECNSIPNIMIIREKEDEDDKKKEENKDKQKQEKEEKYEDVKVMITCSKCNKTNVEKIEMIDQSKFTQSTGRKCSNDNHAPVDAVKFCPSCNKYYCVNCLVFHNGINKEHKLIPCGFNVSSKCGKHDSPFTNYCQTDKIELCSSCSNDHIKKEHKVIELSQVVTQDAINKIKDNIKLAEKKISENEAIKDKIIDKLKKECEEKVSKINESFNKNNSTNTYIINLIKTMVSNFDELNGNFNYNIMNNIIINTNFNLDIPSNEDDYQKIIDYFKKDLIIKRKYLINLFILASNIS